jgi:hypothetical protein
MFNTLNANITKDININKLKEKLIEKNIIKKNAKLLLENSSKQKIKIKNIYLLKRIKDVALILISNENNKEALFYSNKDGSILIPFNINIISNNLQVIIEIKDILKKINKNADIILTNKITDFNKNIKIVSKRKVGNFNQLELVELEINKKMITKLMFQFENKLMFDFSTKILTKNIKDMNILNYILEINSKNKKRNENILIEKNKEQTIVQKIKELPKKNYISFNKKIDKNKSNLYLFIDPECPYCADELNNFEKYSKIYNLYLILTPVHGINAYIKSSLILNNFNVLDSFDNKINLFKKYFDKNIILSKVEINNTNIDLILNNKKIFFESKLLNKVPYKIID